MLPACAGGEQQVLRKKSFGMRSSRSAERVAPATPPGKALDAKLCARVVATPIERLCASAQGHPLRMVADQTDKSSFGNSFTEAKR